MLFYMVVMLGGIMCFNQSGMYVRHNSNSSVDLMAMFLWKYFWNVPISFTLAWPILKHENRPTAPLTWLLRLTYPISQWEWVFQQAESIAKGSFNWQDAGWDELFFCLFCFAVPLTASLLFAFFSSVDSRNCPT